MAYFSECIMSKRVQLKNYISPLQTTVDLLWLNIGLPLSVTGLLLINCELHLVHYNQLSEFYDLLLAYHDLLLILYDLLRVFPIVVISLSLNIVRLEKIAAVLQQRQQNNVDVCVFIMCLYKTTLSSC